MFHYACMHTGEHLNWQPMTNGQKLGRIADRCSRLVDDLTTGYNYLDDSKMKEKKTMKNDYTACHKRNLFIIDKLEIKDVIFSGPCTIVKWSDGDKTIVRCENEDFDREKGLAMAICKKMMGTNKTKSNYNNIFKKWCNGDESGAEADKIKMLTVREFAKITGSTVGHVQKECRDGLRPGAIKVDGKWSIPYYEK